VGRIQHPDSEPKEYDISEIRIRLLDLEKDGLIGFASCVLNGSYFLNNIAIRRGQDSRLFLSYPAGRSNHDVQHFHWNPISKRASEALEAAILGRLRAMRV
jgi:DNA-binding cell septation regulator SpoVG